MSNRKVAQNMEELVSVVELYVFMDCAGCVRKVRKAIANLKGVNDVSIDPAMQKVTVTGWVKEKEVLKAARKTGRRATLWPSAGAAARHLMLNAEPRSYNYYRHGYDDSSLHEYYYLPPGGDLIDDKIRNLFSDENPTSCSIL